MFSNIPETKSIKMKNISGNKQILSLLVQSSLAGLLLSFSINAVHTYLGGMDESPDLERCNELTNFSKTNQFETLKDFYPYYLCEHTLAKTKLLHFIGTFNVLVFFVTVVNNKINFSSAKLLAIAIVQVFLAPLIFDLAH
jgi:hypothetical protein